MRADFTWFLAAVALGVSSGCGDGESDSEGVGSGLGGTGGALGAGGAPVAGSTCEPADPSLTEANAQALFDYPTVPTFRFSLPEADWAALQANARDEQYVEAQACFEGQLIGTVGLRFKGYYGSLYECFDEQDQMICPRLSMKVKFDEYVDGQRFFGLKRLNFNAYRYDDSRMKERLTYDIFRAMGIVTPRAAWAVVEVNGESLGLFGMVEQIDGRFTADRWPESPDGNLYKELWPTVGAGEDQMVSALKTNEEEADVDNYLAFSQAMSSASEDDALRTLGQYTDLEYWARYLAADDATLNYDGITYMWTDGVERNNHNYYFYEEGPENFVLIPWDVESSFWINPDHQAPHWSVIPEDCSITYDYWGGLAHAPACDPVLRALAGNLGPWRAACRELLNGAFSEEALLASIDRYLAFIGPAARADPTPNVYGSFDGSVQYLRASIPSIRERLEALIAE